MLPPKAYIRIIVAFMIRLISGKAMDIIIMARMVESHRSSLATLNFAFSWSARANAFTTRMPERFSCITVFTRSSFSCMDVNSGRPRLSRNTIITVRNGIAASTTSDSFAFSTSTITTPPMHRNGARTSMRMQVVNAF